MKITDNKAFYRVIKEVRKQKGLTQSELGKKVGLNGSYISAIELGRVNMSIDKLMKVYKALSIDLKVSFFTDNKSVEYYHTD